MKDKHISQKLLSVLVIIAMVVTAVIPTGMSVSAASAGSVDKMLNTTIHGDIGEKGKDNRVTGFTEDADGNLIVMGTATSKIGDNDSADGGKRVFLKKYSKSDLDNAQSTAVIGGSEPEAIQKDGYTFGEIASEYYAGDVTYNGALTTDAEGNIYVAVTENSSKEALYEDYWDLPENIEGCICENEGYFCNEDGCESGTVDNCPVCNAFRNFQAEFQEEIPQESRFLNLIKT